MGASEDGRRGGRCRRLRWIAVALLACAILVACGSAPTAASHGVLAGSAKAAPTATPTAAAAKVAVAPAALPAAAGKAITPSSTARLFATPCPTPAAASARSLAPSPRSSKLAPLTTSAPARRLPAPTLAPWDRPSLTYIHMIDARIGWATDRAEGAVLRTTNGARTWRRTMPEGLPFRSITASYFLDAAHAWILTVPPEALSNHDPARLAAVPVVVYSTADGGRTWRHGAAFAADISGRFAFADPQHGWLLVSRGFAAGSEAVSLFRTVDGGQHWRLIAATPETVPASPAGSIPFGCHKDDLAFRDATTGWLAVACAGPAPYVLATTDGGRTWRRVAIPPPVGQPLLRGEFAVGAPQFFPSSGAVLLVRVLPNQALLYVTTDGGRTWTGRPLPTAAPFGFSFLNADVGWVGDGQRLYATRDGDRHWTTITPNVSLYQTMLDFVNDKVGFAVAANASTDVLTTTDGGHTWTRLPVEVAP